MAHFAQIDQNDVVIRVLVVGDADAPTEAAGVAFLEKITGGTGWVQTSYNSRDGVNDKGAPAVRGTYAGVGHKYDPVLDAFLPPQPFPSWTATDKGTWKAPKDMPADGKLYQWVEAKKDWEVVT